MAALWALARISLLEFARERIVWLFLFVGIGLYGFSLILGNLSFSEQQRILAHFGLMSIEISNLGIVLFLASRWLQKEMDHQTCLMVLVRPVSRAQFYLGKFLGIWALSLILQILMGLTLFGLLESGFSALHFLQICIGTFCELTLILALTFFAATFLRAALAFFFGFGIFLMGRWVQEIEFFGKKFGQDFYVSLAQAVKWFIPHLFQMNWRSIYFLENGVSSGHLGWVVFHSAAWVLLTLFCGIAVLRYKDLV